MSITGNITGNDLVGNVQDKPTPLQDIFSMEVGNIFRVVNYVVLCALIALFGIAANAINMIVFYRQGFNTTTNISFFAMAISDMGCLVTIQWFAICLNPYLETADINFIPEDLQYMSGAWFHIVLGRVTSWITVFITAERCLGITLPLKVKQIITLKRTKIVMCLIFTLNISVLSPEYAITYLDWKFVPKKNRTLLGLLYRPFKGQTYGVVYILISVSGFLSFICVLLLTIFLVTKLAQISKWRMKATGGADSSDNVSSRDKKTVKMVIMIATVLIVCYTPGTTISLFSSFVPEFMIGKAFASSYYAFWSIAFVCDTINSSINVFLYYRMSTKYRQTFNDIFSSCIKTERNSVPINECR